MDPHQGPIPWISPFADPSAPPGWDPRSLYGLLAPGISSSGQRAMVEAMVAEETRARAMALLSPQGSPRSSSSGSDDDDPSLSPGRKRKNSTAAERAAILAKPPAERTDREKKQLKNAEDYQRRKAARTAAASTPDVHPPPLSSMPTLAPSSAPSAAAAASLPPPVAAASSSFAAPSFDFGAAAVASQAYGVGAVTPYTVGHALTFTSLMCAAGPPSPKETRAMAQTLLEVRENEELTAAMLKAAEDAAWEKAKRKKAVNLYNTGTRSLAWFEERVNLVFETARHQGRCAGPGYGARKHSLECQKQGIWPITPDAMLSAITEFAHKPGFERDGDTSLVLHYFVYHDSHTLDEIAEFLTTGRWLHIDCHGIETKKMWEQRSEAPRRHTQKQK